MKIAMASDHAGSELRAAIRAQLVDRGHEVIDHGPSEDGAVDYPDYAARVARQVQGGEVERGVLCCGSGIGMMITANRFSKVRAVIPFNAETARLCRQHNDSNVVCFGQRTQDRDEVLELLGIWLETEFEGGRHARRVGLIDDAPCG